MTIDDRRYRGLALHPDSDNHGDAFTIRIMDHVSNQVIKFIPYRGNFHKATKIARAELAGWKEDGDSYGIYKIGEHKHNVLIIDPEGEAVDFYAVITDIQFTG